MYFQTFRAWNGMTFQRILILNPATLKGCKTM